MSIHSPLVSLMAVAIAASPVLAAAAPEYDLRKEFAQLTEADKVPFDDFNPVLGYDYAMLRVPLMRGVHWDIRAFGGDDEEIGWWGHEQMSLLVALFVEKNERHKHLKSAHAAPEAPLGVHLGNGLFLDPMRNLTFLVPALLDLVDASSYTVRTQVLSGRHHHGDVTRAGSTLEIRTANRALPPAVVEIGPAGATHRTRIKKNKFLVSSVEVSGDKADYGFEGRGGKRDVTLSMERDAEGIVFRKTPYFEEGRLVHDRAAKTLALGKVLSVAHEGSLISARQRVVDRDDAPQMRVDAHRTKTGIYIVLHGPDKIAAITKLQPTPEGLLRIQQTGDVKAESVTLYRLEMP